MSTRAGTRSVAIAAALVLLAGVGAVVRYQLGYPLNPLESIGRNSSAEGRRELRALRRDRVLDVRAPGTRLRRATENAAGKDWWGADQPTEIRRLFTLRGEPGDAVDLYRARAEAGGWTLIETRCSFFDRSTSVLLTREVAGRRATLKVYGHLVRPLPDTQAQGLLVHLEVEAPDRPAMGAEGAGLRPHDVHCLRAFDPASPALQPPTRRPSSATEICALLTLAEARRVVPAVTTVETSTNVRLACRYEVVTKGGFVVWEADRPRAYYEDRQVAAAGAGFIIVGDEAGRPTGAWVDTRVGPVELYAGPAGMEPGRLVTLAQLLSRR